MSRRTTRRRFIQETTLAGLGFWAAGGVSLASASKSANEKINIACIGVNGKGSSDVDGASKVGQIVALCDVDEDFLDGKASKFPDAKKFFDYREMLDKMGDKIDAVTVSTPDHTHAPASLMAMRKGKHVYCQKPLTHTVAEAREMRETAAKNKCVTQMGNQGSASNGLREGVEVVQSGAIGTVREVHVWTNRPIWPQAPQFMARPKEEDPVPKYLHWDLWLGVAPARPFAHGPVNPKNPKRGIYHDFAWRGWIDFGTGAIGDMACHTANLAYRALKLGLPSTIVAEAGDVNTETWPSWAQIDFQFPAREGLPEVKFTWYEGHKDGKKVLPPEKLVEIMKGTKEGLKDSGSLLIGDKGMLYSPDDYGGHYVLLPLDGFKDYKKPEPTLPRNGKDDDGMKVEWAAGIQGGPAPYSNFEIASRLTESMLLGDVAIRATGKKLEYDGEKGRITNNAEADKMLKTEYRTGW